MDELASMFIIADVVDSLKDEPKLFERMGNKAVGLRMIARRKAIVEGLKDQSIFADPLNWLLIFESAEYRMRIVKKMHTLMSKSDMVRDLFNAASRFVMDARGTERASTPRS